MSACPECLYFNSTVRLTRQLQNGWIRRRRVCNDEKCGNRWYTIEIPQHDIEPNADADAMKEIQQWSPRKKRPGKT